MARPTVPDLFIEVTAANGTNYKLDANQAADSRPYDLSFSTKIGEGFSAGLLRLARRIDKDYPDLDLGNSVVIRTADGSIVFEGYIAAMPRDLTDSHWIGVTLTGWMAHAKDRKFTELYVDRVGKWGPPSLGRKAGLLGSNSSPVDPDSVTDPTNGQSGVATHIDGSWASPYMPVCEAWYDAGPGLTIGKIGYSWKRESTANVGTSSPWIWQVYTSSDDKATTTSASGTLVAAGPSTLQTFTPTSAYRYAALQFYYNSTPGGADGARFALDWYNLAVYGSHGITTHTGDSTQPDGLYLSDIITNIAQRFCPLLDTSGVQFNDYVVQHCAYTDLTAPYDAFIDLNKYSLWHIGVWDNRTLTFRPYDFTRYDWEIRTDDPGTQFSPQGPSTDDFFNGIQVVYTNSLTGIVDILSPDSHSELVDSSTTNSWNAHNRDHWTDISISVPVLQAQALSIGQAALGDKNRPKTPGTLSVTGSIRDSAGNQQPVSKIRAGQTISITNFPNNDPRLIVETNYNAETGENQLAIDKPFAALDAYLDRQSNALTAAGLSRA